MSFDPISLLPLSPVRAPLLMALRQTLPKLRAARDLDALLAMLLAALRDDFRLPHVMLLMANKSGHRLYAVTGQGCSNADIGAAFLPRQSLTDMAVHEQTTIRVTDATHDYLFGRAIRDALHARPMAAQLEAAIPLPDRSENGSQIAVPILDGSTLLGVIYAESPEAERFGDDEEDALMILAAEAAAAMCQLPNATEDGADPVSENVAVDSDTPLLVRHYPADDSVFIDDQYVIKGVAGAILWFLLGEHARSGRVEFSNKELRLSPQIRLPAFSENLEARLILLRRRLAERSQYLALDKAGRGRFRLNLSRPVRLIEPVS